MKTDCYDCIHCAADMDMDAFCTNPKLPERNRSFGLYLRHARGLEFCGPNHAWFEPAAKPLGARMTEPMEQFLAGLKK